MPSIRELTIDDYDAVIALWREAEGVHLSEADSREAIRTYLERNHGSSLAACDGTEIVGAVLCGHDGRRGYLHHLAVAPTHRRQGLGRALVQRCLATLAANGIVKCHLFVVNENTNALAFWKRIGWQDRSDIRIMSLAF